MIRHYIILGTSYVHGKRLAYDITGEDPDGVRPEGAVRYIRERCGERFPLASQVLWTASPDWASVQTYDSWFETVEAVPTLEKFADMLEPNTVLSGLDVAKFILARAKECTQMKLQKLTYFCYADYLCQYGGRLFADQILAYDFGPAVESVHRCFQGMRGDLKQDPAVMQDIRCQKLPSASRVATATDGRQKERSILNTLARYGRLSAGALADLACRKGTPWEVTHSQSGAKTVIPDDLIVQCHAVETL